MNYGVYCIKDVKVGFMNPFVQPNDAIAVREFGNLVNSPGTSTVSVNYEDMELYRLGSYCQDTGVISSCVEYLVKGVDVKRVVSND